MKLTLICYISYLPFIFLVKAGIFSVIASPVKTDPHLIKKTQDCNVSILNVVWKLTGNKNINHSNNNYKTIVITHNKVFLYTDEENVITYDCTITPQKFSSQPNNTSSFLIKLAAINEQWICQVMKPSIATDMPCENSWMMLMRNPECKCDCPYEVYQLEKPEIIAL